MAKIAFALSAMGLSFLIGGYAGYQRAVVIITHHTEKRLAGNPETFPFKAFSGVNYTCRKQDQ